MRRLFLLVLLCVIYAAGSAQITGAVFVKRSGSAIPQPGAEIVLFCQNGKVQFKTISNTEGNFHVSMPPAGNYKIQMSFTGFKSHHDHLAVSKQIRKIELAPILLEPTTMSVMNIHERLSTH